MILNHSTGEVDNATIEIQEKSGAPQIKTKEPFAMNYFNGINLLHQLRLSGRERDVLDELILNMTINEPFTRPSPTRIARAIGSDRFAVHSYLKTLREKGVLIDITRDKSLLNPRLFWRGNEEARREWIIRLEVGGVLPMPTPAQLADEELNPPVVMILAEETVDA
jgi:hypothetical protein